MNKTTTIIIGVIVVAVVAKVAYFSTSKDNDEMMDVKTYETSTMESKDTMMKDNGSDTMDEGEVTMTSGSYEAYAAEKLARAETGDVVLFFHASWCPSCRGLNADIEKNQRAIPPELSILKVDYDAETELKKKYAVTYQHTLVHVAADGTMIEKWSGSPSLAKLVAELN